jgi:hypothetical protein
MLPIQDYMDKKIRVTDTDGAVFEGMCTGVYGSVQNKEEYGVFDNSLDIYINGAFVNIYQGEIKDVQVLEDMAMLEIAV